MRACALSDILKTVERGAYDGLVPQTMWKKLLAIAFGTLLGVVLTVACWGLWGIVHPSARPLTAQDRTQLRQKLDENPTAIFMYDEATSFRYKPSFRGYRLHPRHLGARDQINYAHVTNSLGLIGAEEVSSDRRLPKVLLLGDSVTYGVWMDEKDTFPARMQQIAGPTCQVMLGACEGWSTKQEIAFFDAYLRGVKWTEVLLVFALNDLVDFEWKYEMGKGPQLTEEILEAGTGGTKTNQSINGIKLALMRQKFSADPQTAPLAGQVNTVLWAWDDKRWDHYLQATLAPFIERVVDPPVSIVMAPTEGQVKALALGASADLVMFPQSRMQAFCERKNLTCIDLAEAFAGTKPDDVDKFYLDDLHFSEEGHAAVARYLWPRVKAMLDYPLPGRRGTH
jgi:GDSL-like Lipase/Acylhydrolase family